MRSWFLLLLVACKNEPKDDFALDDAVVLTRKDSEAAFMIARITLKGTSALPTPVAKVSVKNAKGDLVEIGICETPATTVEPQKGAWCMFSAPEQRSFVDFATRFEAGKSGKKPRALGARDTTILASVGPEVPKVTGNVVNESRDTVKWTGTVAIARNTAGKIVGAGMHREAIPIEPGASHDIVLPLRFLTEKPAKIELVPFGEEP